MKMKPRSKIQSAIGKVGDIVDDFEMIVMSLG